MATDRVPLTVEQKRAACLEMADWLEGREYRLTLPPDADMEQARMRVQSWVQGYRRAIFELRWAAREPVEVIVPNDISELDTPEAQ